jgi:hypothetical protein
MKVISPETAAAAVPVGTGRKIPVSGYFTDQLWRREVAYERNKYL